LTVDVRPSPDAAGLAAETAAFVAARVADAVAARGQASVAVSGGGTPARMFAALAMLDVPWAGLHLFQVDERIAPLGDPDRNLGELAANLLELVPIPWRNVHLMPVDAQDPIAASKDYAATLQRVCVGVLDLVHLGLGHDGHTASWPPGDPDVGTWTDDVAVTSPFNGRRRMTLTPPAVNRAREIVWLASGSDKAPMLVRLLSHDATIPAGRVDAEHQVLFADEAALSAQRP
jgi:6-phosphogluconolactonase